MKNQEAATVAEALEHSWFHRHGYPLALLSDQCPNVDGTVIREICAKYGIRKFHSSPYHPEGDGEAERTIQSFKQCMHCFLEERRISRTHWPRLTQEISFICNSQINASTKCSPHEVMFGEKLRGKVDAVIPYAEHTSYDDPTSYCEAVSPRNVELYDRIAENIDRAQKKMKTAYDRKTSPSDVQSGDWVLVKDETRRSSLAPLYVGPWLVVERVGVNLSLVDPSSKRKKIVHLNRCKITPRNGDENLTVNSEDIERVETEDGNSNVDLELANEGRRRSSRIRREPDRYGDFVYYWQNRGNDSRVDNDFEGEGEMSCSYESQ